MNDQQFDKLPQYAQEEITRLRIRNAGLQEKLDQFGGVKDSPIAMLATVEKHRPLPNGTVRFSLGEKYHADVRIEKGCLDVNFSGGMMIRPMSSNLAQLHPTPIGGTL